MLCLVLFCWAGLGCCCCCCCCCCCILFSGWFSFYLFLSRELFAVDVGTGSSFEIIILRLYFFQLGILVFFTFTTRCFCFSDTVPTENSRMQMRSSFCLFVCFSCCLVHQSAWLMTKANKVEDIHHLSYFAFPPHFTSKQKRRGERRAFAVEKWPVMTRWNCV